MQPHYFNEEPNVEVIEHWLRCMKKILVGLDIPEEMMVGPEAYMLVDKGNIW